MLLPLLACAVTTSAVSVLLVSPVYGFIQEPLGVVLPRKVPSGVWAVLADGAAITVLTLPGGLIVGVLVARLLNPPDDGLPRCSRCRHILKGLTAPRCPECGTPI